MAPRFRVSRDGFLDLRDTRRVKTPGKYDPDVVAAPEAEAVSFLLSHSFPSHRRVVRSLRETERRKIRMASWADSVGERMTLVDQVWRAITEPTLPPKGDQPVLVQVLCYGSWAYPLYLDGKVTRVMPAGGVPLSEVEIAGASHLDLRSA